MATYFERMRAGMQHVQGVLLELLPNAEFEWGPMDDGGNYPFFFRNSGKRVLFTVLAKTRWWPLAMSRTAAKYGR